MIGSTCKPVIDIQAAVKELPPKSRLIILLEELGYQHKRLPPQLKLDNSIAFFEKEGFSLQLKIKGNSFWTSALILRDFYRTHPEEV